MNNHLKINDFVSISSDVDKLIEEISKAHSVIFSEGKDDILPIYIRRAFAKVEDCINEVTNEQKKKFNKLNSVSYNKLK